MPCCSHAQREGACIGWLGGKSGGRGGAERMRQPGHKPARCAGPLREQDADSSNASGAYQRGRPQYRDRIDGRRG
eukprot:364493-Chlamydomonas_euryale.AAC.13